MADPVGVMAAGEIPQPPVSPAPASKYKGIAILGSHPETKMQAPFDDPSWLIYACSPHNSPYGGLGASALPRVNQRFELHIPLSHPSRPYGYLRWLADQPEPLWLRDQEALRWFPGARLYPEAELKKRFGWPAFTSTIAYIAAKAIVDCEELGIPAIALFGILQATRTEYELHKTGTQQMIYEADKAGITVLVPPQAKHLIEPPPENW